jgi:xanthine/CO dehydrogenase XdhC/CoxF family maturation factor
MILRLLGFLLAFPCLIVGAFGLGAGHFPNSGLVATGRALLATLTGPLSGLLGSELSAASIERMLGGLPALGLLGVGVVVLFLSVRRGVDLGVEEEPAETEENSEPAPLEKRLVRQTLKQAAALAKKGKLSEAAEFCLSSGVFDQAAEYFEQAEDLVRAAEVRHDQNRFTEAAELYIRAGQHETAATIFASTNEFAQAADSYLKAGRISVAAEMFEKAGRHTQAGECYSQCDFHRHAAQAFLKAEEWAPAAQALEAVILEEGLRVGGGPDPAKEKELRKLVLQSGKLYEHAGDLEASERILEKGGCFNAAADVAIRLEHFSKASDLFVRGGDPVKAADALQQVATLLGWNAVVTQNAGDASGLIATLASLDSVVVLGHDLELTGRALTTALSGDVGYIGAVGSKRLQETRADWLAYRGVTDLGRLSGPAGLNIGARNPQEVALAIAAEIVATQTASPTGSPSERDNPPHER